MGGGGGGGGKRKTMARLKKGPSRERKGVSL